MVKHMNTDREAKKWQNERREESYLRTK